jgi:hypothetical protein
MNESDIRHWLREAFGEGLQWVEAARGGTVGQPDVLMPTKFGKLPVELKFWSRTRKGIRAEIRPTQRRFHILEARAGRRTAFIVGLQANEKDLSLFAFPGHRAPLEPYGKLWLSALPWWATRMEILEVIEEPKFWEGW